jgi:hypothetical protein
MGSSVLHFNNDRLLDASMPAAPLDFTAAAPAMDTFGAQY